MNIIIWGAGGIGCYYGSRLLSAGHQVTFVARGGHLAALQNTGLTVSHDVYPFSGPVVAVDEKTLLTQYRCASFDLIIVATKATVIPALLEHATGWLNAANTPVLSLQNGVDSERLFAEVIGAERVIGGLAVRIGGHIQVPGVIQVTGPGQIVLGEWPNKTESSSRHQSIDAIAEAFIAAHIPTTVTDNIVKELWKKLLINNGVNPLSALTDMDTQALIQHPIFSKTVYQMMQEAAQAAQGDGVDMSDQDVDEMYEVIRGFNAIKTSMLVDKEKGRPLELDSICGAVVERSIQIGIHAPVTECVLGLLQQQQSKQHLTAWPKRAQQEQQQQEQQ